MQMVDDCVACEATCKHVSLWAIIVVCTSIARAIAPKVKQRHEERVCPHGVGELCQWVVSCWASPSDAPESDTHDNAYVLAYNVVGWDWCNPSSE